MVHCVHKSPQLAWLRAAQGRRIGLFGGSFNPVHEGHWQCAETLRKSLKLDQVWWLPAPENPLKLSANLIPFSKRYAALKHHIGDHPYHQVCDILDRENFLYTIDFLVFLHTQKRSNAFVWLSGSDILQELHHWKNWRQLDHYCAMAFYSRPNHALARTSSPAGHLLRRYPLIVGRRVRQSSSALRRQDNQ